MKELVTLKDVVRGCAQDPSTVAAFNKLYGTKLKAPLLPLLAEDLPATMPDAEQEVYGLFIVFVHDNIWPHAKKLLKKLRRA